MKDRQPIVSAEKQNELSSRTAEEQIKNDKTQWENFLNAGKDEPLPKGSSSEKSYALKQDVMTRIFMLIQNTELVKTHQGNTQQNDPKLNVASVLSHGGRLVIQVPALGETGVNADALKNAIMGENHEERDQIIKKRDVASHTLEIKNNDNNEKRVVEKLLSTKGVKGDYGTLIADASMRRHYKMNVGVTQDGAGPDNGTNGHVYFYWMPPTKDTPGGLMIGVETCEAGKTNPYGATHDANAQPGQFSSTGGTKFSSEAFKAHQNAGMILCPADKDGNETGLKIELGNKHIQNINALITVDKSHPLELGKNVEVKLRHTDSLNNSDVVKEKLKPALSRRLSSKFITNKVESEKRKIEENQYRHHESAPQKEAKKVTFDLSAPKTEPAIKHKK